MAVVITGTPVEIIWEAGQNPATQDITIPSDATAVYMFWTFFGNNSYGLLSATLEGVSYDAAFEIASIDNKTGTGVVAWYNPGTGSGITVDISWDAAPSEGPTTIIAFVKGGNTTAWRDADADADLGSGYPSVIIDTNSTDLVLKYDQTYGTTPDAGTGWTSLLAGANGGENVRLSSCDSPGASTTTVTSGLQNFSTILSISIPASAADTIEQEGFRFRNDDGDEDGATWKANQDVNVTLPATTAARIRMLLNATGDPASKNYQLEYRYKPSGGAFGSWTKVR